LGAGHAWAYTGARGEQEADSLLVAMREAMRWILGGVIGGVIGALLASWWLDLEKRDPAYRGVAVSYTLQCAKHCEQYRDFRVSVRSTFGGTRYGFCTCYDHWGEVPGTHQMLFDPEPIDPAVAALPMRRLDELPLARQQEIRRRADKASKEADKRIREIGDLLRAMKELEQQ
jgi:hypothetical protein